MFSFQKQKIRVTQVPKEYKKALSLFWVNRNTSSAVKFFRGKTVFLHLLQFKDVRKDRGIID